MTKAKSQKPKAINDTLLSLNEWRYSKLMNTVLLLKYIICINYLKLCSFIYILGKCIIDTYH